MDHLINEPRPTFGALKLPIQKSQSVLDCAAFFLDLLGNERIEINRLHRLLYIAQGFALGLGRTPLFDEPIEAWISGPVILSLYTIKGVVPWVDRQLLVGDPNLSLSDAKFLKEIWDMYGRKKLEELDRETQGTGPWKEARTRCSKAGIPLISHELMAHHFAEVIRRHQERK
jgi:uncharacterized phage-associated protein